MLLLLVNPAVFLHHLRLVLLQGFFTTFPPCSELRAAVFALGGGELDLHVKILELLLARLLINVDPFEHPLAKIFALKRGHGQRCHALMRVF